MSTRPQTLDLRRSAVPLIVGCVISAILTDGTVCGVERVMARGVEVKARRHAHLEVTEVRKERGRQEKEITPVENLGSDSTTVCPVAKVIHVV
jgi:hypothetical protein